MDSTDINCLIKLIASRRIYKLDYKIHLWIDVKILVNIFSDIVFTLECYGQD